MAADSRVLFVVAVVFVLAVLFRWKYVLLFLFAIGASESWCIVYNLFPVNAANTADIKLDVAAPSGATIRIGNIGLANALTGVQGDVRIQGRADGGTLESGVVATATSGGAYVYVAAYVANSTNAGNVTLRWAQQTTDGSNATVLKAGSFLVAYQVV